MKLSDIAIRIAGKVIGDPSIEIEGVGPIESAKAGEITLLVKDRYKRYLKSTQASAIITNERLSYGIADRTLLVVDDPYLAFADVIEMFAPKNYQPVGISSKAFISDEAFVQSGTTIMDGAYIEKGAYIGKNTVIYPNVYVGYLSTIGDNCIIFPNVVIRERCIIGNNVIVHSGTIIGADGFGFIQGKNGYRKVMQIGAVLIEDNVEIGANCTIDRATVGETVIKKGTKLDNLIQVGHNVVIGENTIIAGQSGIAGSTQIGSWVQIGGQAGIAGHLVIGDRVRIGGKSGVISDVDSEKEVAGYPAVERWEWFKMYGLLKNMLIRRQHFIESQVENRNGEGQKKYHRGEFQKKDGGFSNRPFEKIGRNKEKL